MKLNYTNYISYTIIERPKGAVNGLLEAWRTLEVWYISQNGIIEFPQAYL